VLTFQSKKCSSYAHFGAGRTHLARIGAQAMATPGLAGRFDLAVNSADLPNGRRVLQYRQEIGLQLRFSSDVLEDD
jgi:hypothetical protein